MRTRECWTGKRWSFIITLCILTFISIESFQFNLQMTLILSFIFGSSIQFDRPSPLKLSSSAVPRYYANSYSAKHLPLNAKRNLYLRNFYTISSAEKKLFYTIISYWYLQRKQIENGRTFYRGKCETRRRRKKRKDIYGLFYNLISMRLFFQTEHKVREKL